MVKLFPLLRSIFVSMGLLWLPIEAFEGLTTSEVPLPFNFFLLLSILTGFVFFLVDGFFLTGFLKHNITIPNNGSDTSISIKFGDIFEEQGWKAIGVNDFFDSEVDDNLISSKSLHGIVINKFWNNDANDWQTQVNKSLESIRGRHSERIRGNQLRYRIGTTGYAQKSKNKFLFVALGKTNKDTNITTANSENLIAAVRGLLVKAREICSNETLIIPLMGSGLSRVGIKPSVLVDLILTGVFEETKSLKITDNIIIVLPKKLKSKINLGTTLRNWK